MTTQTPTQDLDPRLARLSRLQPAPSQREHMEDLVKLPLTRQAFVYQRLSTHEQRKKSIWSLEMQDALVQQAYADGYGEQQVIVERRDLGISGTKGREQRPGLAAMIEAIEAGTVEAVYVVHISRISRDQTLIDGLEFGELCKRHRVIIVMPTMRLNLRDEMHMRLYRMEIERAADEITLLKQRLGGPKRHKALSGRWEGRSVPAGYRLDVDPESPSNHRYVVYEPHAAIVREVFRAVIETGTPMRAARWLRHHGIAFPPFPPELSEDERRSSLQRRRSRPIGSDGSEPISPSQVYSIATNPAYLGWWVVTGTLVHRQNHPAIVDEVTFLEAQETLIRHGRKDGAERGRGSAEPRMLAGLLWCTRHAVPQAMQGASTVKGRQLGRYQCDDEYDNGQQDHVCTVVGANLIDHPVADVVLNRCSFPEYADAVLAHMEREYDADRERARKRRAEVARLEGEMQALRTNLAATRTPEQVQMIFDLIEERKERIAALTEERIEPNAHPLTSAQVATVRAFLSDLRSGWHLQPVGLKNEFLRLVLARVLVNVEDKQITATIEWRTGDVQHILIERPIDARGKTRWTDDEDAWLREHYATATADELREHFPHRTYASIRKRADPMGLRRDKQAIHTPVGPAWMAAEDAAIGDHAAGRTSYEALRAALPGRTWDAIVWRRQKLGLPGRTTTVHYQLTEAAQEVVSIPSPSRTGR